MAGDLKIAEAKQKLLQLANEDPKYEQEYEYDIYGRMQLKYDYLGRPIMHYPVREAAQRALSQLP